MIVYLGARDAERGRAAARDLNARAGADVRFVRLDVTEEAQIAAAVRRVDEECGRLDVLVNNAGVVVEWGVPVQEVTTEQLRRVFDVNVFGAAAMTRACVPLLRRSTAGQVVNLSSPLGSLSLLSDPDDPVSTRGLLAYSSSKAALNAITVLYANALRDDSICVNAANPGLVATDLNAPSQFGRGVRTAEQGAEVPVALALMGADGPTGAFCGDNDSSVDATVPW
ncbi:SDR family NAD(P)-dependent oxidoreductase [Saccharopolyspora sp. NPDC050389]|uniref:SDR family NAD(P)-dependent oxidoreductase n=1 Tax=Saccharopolyspora sp. NPDC050389 TaxID=3155516 RepID=UPI0033DD7AA9